ncbi:MAG: DUF2851 family protein [Opitutales bacterium]|jgi:hypothetical protein
MVPQLVAVREIQGLYGPVRLSERLLQLIWRRRDYSEKRLRSLDGRPVRVIRPGSWNHREGPDFLDAIVEIGGKRVRGDVEIHFRSRNWREHDHHLDPAFSSVVLHVVLFPPREDECPAITQRGFHPPTCSMLEALEIGLEEYAEQEAVRLLCDDDKEFCETYSLLLPDERQDHLKQYARKRWDAKVTWAAKRLEATSWAESCHQFFLEVMGYHRNRAVMGTIALEHPLSALTRNLPDPDELFQSRADEWKLAGLRPANHPRVRLRQYLEIVACRADWPDLVLGWLHALRSGGEMEETSSFRKKREMSLKGKELSEHIIGGVIGSGRFNTWMADGLLPLAAAKMNQDLFGWWFHWYAGNAPDQVTAILRELGVIGKFSATLCNGWVQGALGAVTALSLRGEQVED